MTDKDQRPDWGDKPLNFKTLEGTPYKVEWITSGDGAAGHTLFFGLTSRGMSHSLFGILPEAEATHGGMPVSDVTRNGLVWPLTGDSSTS